MESFGKSYSEDVPQQIGQLIFEIHLHWPGFGGQWQ